jgi:Pyridine nucleotide-disulphide oxidoreductase
VRLDNGSVIDADLIVVGVGVNPCRGWLVSSGLRLHDRDRGVVADTTLRVIEGVYAAVDVAHFPTRCSTALRKGRMAAEHGPEHLGDHMSDRQAEPLLLGKRAVQQLLVSGATPTAPSTPRSTAGGRSARAARRHDRPAAHGGLAVPDPATHRLFDTQITFGVLSAHSLRPRCRSGRVVFDVSVGAGMDPAPQPTHTEEHHAALSDDSPDQRAERSR